MEKEEWNGKEIAMLRRASVACTAEYIATLLPGRSIDSIRKQRQRIGMTKREIVNRVIKQNPGLSARQLSDIAVCDVRTIRKYLI